MKIVTSESVFKGHPDKVCDQISDAILDAGLKEDPNSRVAVECFIKDDFLVVGGEVTTKAKVNYSKVAKDVLKNVGYKGRYCVIEKISTQSKDIALGVDKNGAGDQGLMFGYASDETPELMPLSLVLARKISIKMDELSSGKYQWAFGSDGKCQVSVNYEENKPVSIKAIVVSAQTKKEVSRDTYIGIIINECLYKVIPHELLSKETQILINPTGEFVKGGSFADSGLTGRKIIVDTYGGVAHHGGGAFSGKDPSKVDRSAAYYSRYVAKNIVAAGIAKRCEVGVAYAIGIAEPVSLSVDTFNTSSVSEERILACINKVFDFTPLNILNELKLKEVKYQKLASYGHIGRSDIDVPWEHTDKRDALIKALKDEE